VKARLSYPFGKRVIANKWNFAGILAGACLGMFIIYTPPLHVVFGGSFHLSPLYWLIPVAFGILLLAWASLRVIMLRRSIEHMKVKDIKGLMMCMCKLHLGLLALIEPLYTFRPNHAHDEHAFSRISSIKRFWKRRGPFFL